VEFRRAVLRIRQYVVMNTGHTGQGVTGFGRCRRAPALVALLAAAALAAGCGSTKHTTTATKTGSTIATGGTAAIGGPVAFPAPAADQVAGLVGSAGLVLETHETLVHHVHAHLDMFIDGQHRTVPGGIGIVITDPAVHSGTIAGAPAYGGIQECAQPCISSLHTHDITGILHTESATNQDNTLGQFFQEWSVRLDGSCVGSYCAPGTPITIYVNGKSTPLANAAAIPLSDHKEIAIVIGQPPSRVPAAGDFSAV
jgi:hypothetical protein